MKKDEWDDIDVNERRTDRVYFESAFIQSISDKIDFLKDESREILRDLDSSEFKQRLDDFDLEGFSRDTVNQIDDLFDDISRFKDGVMDSDDFPQDVKKHYRNTQAYLNRDDEYVRRAKRKLAGTEFDDCIRAIELCDKAIKIRKDNFDAYITKAQALIRIEKYSEAIDEYINALSLRDDVEVWLAIANLNRLNGDFDDALDVYDTILEKHINHPDALKGKAYVYFDMGDYVRCDAMFKKSNAIRYLDEDSFAIWLECLENLKNA